MNNKFTSPLLIAGLLIASGTAFAADESAPDASKPPARPTTLPPASTKTDVTFAKDIKPLFDASCVRCHGEQRPKGDLRLDTLEGVLKGSEDGKVLVAGNSAKSGIVVAVARINPKTAMPPEPRQRRGPGGPGGPGASEKSGDVAKTNSAPEHPTGEAGGPGGQGGRPKGPPPKPLTAEEVGLVRAWIDQGAK